MKPNVENTIFTSERILKNPKDIPTLYYACTLKKATNKLLKIIEMRNTNEIGHILQKKNIYIPQDCKIFFFPTLIEC